MMNGMSVMSWKLFGKHTYYRYKQNGRSPPTKTQLKTLLLIEATLTEMKPVVLTIILYEVIKYY